jgi:hypothetical protein
MVPLQQATQYCEYGYEDRRAPERKQSAAHSGPDAVGRIIGADIPTDIRTGCQQKWDN